MAPALRSKRAKTFIDHYLLGHDLTPFTRLDQLSRKLNACELALLAGTMAAAGNAVGAGLAKDALQQVEVHPTPPAALDRVFEDALGTDAMEASAEDAMMMEVGPRVIYWVAHHANCRSPLSLHHPPWCSP